MDYVNIKDKILNRIYRADNKDNLFEYAEAVILVLLLLKKEGFDFPKYVKYKKQKKL